MKQAKQVEKQERNKAFVSIVIPLFSEIHKKIEPLPQSCPVLVLSTIMFTQSMVSVPERFAGLIGAGLIGSTVANHLRFQV